MERLKFLIAFVVGSSLQLTACVYDSPKFDKLTAPKELLYRVVKFNDDKKLLSVDERKALLANLDAAVKEWGQHIYGYAPINIELRVMADTETGRFNAAPIETVYKFTNLSRQDIFEPTTIYKLRTGIEHDAKKPDILIQIQPDFMRKNYWFDPHPETQSDIVPEGKISLVTVLAHELGHGLGFGGELDLKNGTLPSDYQISVYDNLVTHNLTGQPVFTGENATKLNGGPVPLTYFPQSNIRPILRAKHHETEMKHIDLNRNNVVYWVWQNPEQNFYHYGRLTSVTSDSDLTFFGLMGGAFNFKKDLGRIHVGALDWAILKDLGVPTK